MNGVHARSHFGSSSSAHSSEPARWFACKAIYRLKFDCDACGNPEVGENVIVGEWQVCMECRHEVGARHRRNWIDAVTQQITARKEARKPNRGTLGIGKAGRGCSFFENLNISLRDFEHFSF